MQRLLNGKTNVPGTTTTTTTTPNEIAKWVAKYAISIVTFPDLVGTKEVQHLLNMLISFSHYALSLPTDYYVTITLSSSGSTHLSTSTSSTGLMSVADIIQTVSKKIVQLLNESKHKSQTTIQVYDKYLIKLRDHVYDNRIPRHPRDEKRVRSILHHHHHHRPHSYIPSLPIPQEPLPKLTGFKREIALLNSSLLLPRIVSSISLTTSNIMLYGAPSVGKTILIEKISADLFYHLYPKRSSDCYYGWLNKMDDLTHMLGSANFFFHQQYLKRNEYSFFSSSSFRKTGERIDLATSKEDKTNTKEKEEDSEEEEEEEGDENYDTCAVIVLKDLEKLSHWPYTGNYRFLKRIIFLASTSKPYDVHPTVQARFQTKIFVDYPNDQDRYDFFKTIMAHYSRETLLINDEDLKMTCRDYMGLDNQAYRILRGNPYALSDEIIEQKLTKGLWKHKKPMKQTSFSSSSNSLKTPFGFSSQMIHILAERVYRNVILRNTISDSKCLPTTTDDDDDEGRGAVLDCQIQNHPDAQPRAHPLQRNDYLLALKQIDNQFDYMTEQKIYIENLLYYLSQPKPCTMKSTTSTMTTINQPVITAKIDQPIITRHSSEHKNIITSSSLSEDVEPTSTSKKVEPTSTSTATEPTHVKINGTRPKNTEKETIYLKKASELITVNDINTFFETIQKHVMEGKIADNDDDGDLYYRIVSEIIIQKKYLVHFIITNLIDHQTKIILKEHMTRFCLKNHLADKNQCEKAFQNIL
jgi:hypothetical protein